MSYLNPLRLHFSGRFQANTSTVNNDPGHYQNNVFQPNYQELQGPRMNPPNGWFNPEGDGGWRLMGCKVTTAWTPDGPVSGDDPVLDCLVADSDSKVCGKLVDLDPEQQLVSEIWGLQVRICDANGNSLLTGDFEAAAFMDIWSRATGSGASGDTGAGAMYQSVLKNLEWGDVSGSNFLTKLKAAAADGLLSIKFNLDGVNMDFQSADFMSGRIAGTIGPAIKDELKHLLFGRQFMAKSAGGRGFFAPSGKINFFPAVVAEEENGIYLDLGNALTTSSPGGPMNNLGDLTLGVYDPDANPSDPTASAKPLGTIPALGKDGYASASWYANTAGVVLLPLTKEQVTAIAKAPLVLYVEGTSGANQVVISEPPAGAFVRADTYVYRLSPADTAKVEVAAMQFGKPLPKAEVVFEADSGQLQSFNMINRSDPPKVAEPLSALGKFDVSATTLDDGRATLSFTVNDPGTPRNFRGNHYGIDGQVYGLRPKFVDAALNPPTDQINQSNFVSILLWSGFTASDPPTWDDLEPIFQQSANLYPVMNRFLDLGDLDAVIASARLLKLAFSLPISDPNSMPVTRDLSPAKRKAILAWLDNPLPGTRAKATPAATRDAAPEAPEDFPEAAQGGKAAASARRLCLQD